MIATADFYALVNAVNANEPGACAVLADYLEERGDSRAEFLRYAANRLSDNRPMRTTDSAELYAEKWLIFRETWAGEPVVAIYNTLSRARGFNRFHPVKNHRFRTKDRAEQFVTEFKKGQEADAARKEERKQTKKQARDNFANPYKVGDLFYTSWGYDQTNVDWFECVEVGARSVVLREIAQSQEYTTWASGSCSPKEGKYIGEPFRVNIQVGTYADKVHYYLPAKHGNYYPAEGRTSVHFSEWA